LTIGNTGWRPEPLDWLEPEEISTVEKSAESIQEFISEVLVDEVRATLPREALLVG
jgi:hypothetical protein